VRQTLSGGCTRDLIGPRTSCTLMQQKGHSGRGWMLSGYNIRQPAASSTLQVIVGDRGGAPSPPFRGGGGTEGWWWWVRCRVHSDRGWMLCGCNTRQPAA
jgi:hypothetical protein